MITRFAPAPTGYLHLGHVVNAIYVWGLARALGGRVLLRIEDHDRDRSRPEYERAILEDLEWLGFAPDDPPLDAFRAGGCRGRQSDRTAVYEAAVDRLRAGGLVYACDCTRAAIAGAAGAKAGSERRYPGTCATKRLAEAPGRALRVRLHPSVERFEDLRHGVQEQRPFEQCGDMLVKDRHGCWSYQFAVTVDDFEQGVTDVVRGDDLLPSTGRQIQLSRLLGRREPPRFFHHPLVMKSAAQKLSKSDGDTGVRALRDGGWTAARVIGHAASLVGLIPGPRPLPLDALPALVYPPGP